jgi:hypothetical protein
VGNHGKTTKSAPSFAASAVKLATFAILWVKSNATGAACMAATLTF